MGGAKWVSRPLISLAIKLSMPGMGWSGLIFIVPKSRNPRPTTISSCISLIEWKHCRVSQNSQAQGYLQIVLLSDSVFFFFSWRRPLSKWLLHCRLITDAYIFKPSLHGCALGRRRLLPILCLVGFTPLLFPPRHVEDISKSNGSARCDIPLPSLFLTKVTVSTNERGTTISKSNKVNR